MLRARERVCLVYALSLCFSGNVDGKFHAQAQLFRHKYTKTVDIL